jgi:hypothetical protein
MFVLTTRLATLTLLAVAALAQTSTPSAPQPAGMQLIAAGTALLLIGIPRRGPKK